MITIANHLHNVKPSPTLSLTAKVAALKAQGRDIISLGAGEPDFDTPDHIKQAAVEALRLGKTKYTAVQGTLELRQAIKAKFKQDNNLDYELNEIMVSTGGKQVIFNALFATINSGDEVLIPAPYWVSYPDMVYLCSGVPVIIDSKEDNHFKITAQDLKRSITPKTKWLILNSPSNPTGSVYSEDELKELCGVLREHPHVNVMSDEIYEYLMYDNQKFYSIAQIAQDLKDRILIVNGVSKTFSMTGWRIGYGAGPKHLIDAMTMVQSQSTSNPCSIAQEAARVALSAPKDFFGSWLKEFSQRRDFLVERFNKMAGLSCLQAHGAFYLYVSCAGLIGKKTPLGQILQTDQDVCEYFLESQGVALVSGNAFGLSPYFRVSYAVSMETLTQACDRMQSAIAELV